jgi:hypothetical protein
MSKQGSNGTNRGQVCINLHRNKLIFEGFGVDWGVDTTLLLKCGIFEILGQETAHLPI